MKKTSLAFILSIMLLLSVCSPQAPSADNSPAPDEAAVSFASFTAIDLEGNDVDQSIFADYDLTMINIWATFCSPCLREMPELGELAGEYADKGVLIVGIVADIPQKYSGAYDSAMVDVARELVEDTGADYLHMLPSADLVNIKLSQVNAVPETIFVNSAGELVGSSYLGARSGEAWAAIIDLLLDGLRK